MDSGQPCSRFQLRYHSITNLTLLVSCNYYKLLLLFHSQFYWFIYFISVDNIFCVAWFDKIKNIIHKIQTQETELLAYKKVPIQFNNWTRNHWIELLCQMTTRRYIGFHHWVKWNGHKKLSTFPHPILVFIIFSLLMNPILVRKGSFFPSFL